jgi:hypothetical protein
MQREWNGMTPLRCHFIDASRSDSCIFGVLTVVAEGTHLKRLVANYH